MITIDALRVRDRERTPLDGVTMLLTANAVHGIAGEGRSELLRAVYGLAVPESGSVTSGGHPLRRRDMAYLEAEPRFWPGLTAGIVSASYAATIPHRTRLRCFGGCPYRPPPKQPPCRPTSGNGWR